jgi:lantibiotic modifying enzyme
MRPSASQNEVLPVNSENPQMLVIGYHGTLRPDTASPSEDAPARDQPGTVSIASPPQMDQFIEPLLANALLALESCSPGNQRIFAGKQIPLDGLLGLLRRRLQDILTLTIAAHIENADSPTTLTEHKLAHNFPVLATLLQQAVSEWVIAAVTFLQRLQRDASRLAEWLGVGSLPPVESLSATASDTHPGGHVVLCLIFHGGRCVYYKPRAVTGEWLWHSLLESVAEADPSLSLPAARVLPGSSLERYGWMESVTAQDIPQRTVEKPAEGPLYWRSAGAMLCLAYHACLTDLHLGNIIATPRGPAVTDAECLGTPGVPAAQAITRDSTEHDAFLESVMDTGLLPGRSTPDLPDVSGLFGSAAPVPGLRLPQWTLQPNGQYRLTMAPACLLDHGNKPDDASPLTAMPHILEGYRLASKALLRARKTLLHAQSRWRSVLERQHAPRIVVRETFHYGLSLSRSLEPEQLRSEQQRRNMLLDALQKDAPAITPDALLRTELHSLLHLHVPRFVLLPGTRTLASGSGRSLGRNYASCTPVEVVIRRMEKLSEESLESVHVPAILLAAFRAGGIS